MYTGMLHTHTLVVILFLLQYLIKTLLLLLNKNEALETYTRKTKVPEMIVSFLFLATGVYLAFNSGNNGTWLWVKLIAVLLSIPLAVVAFKKKIKMMAVISLLLIVYAYGVSETKSPVFKKAGTATNEFTNVPEAELGKAIYDSKCMNCHGPDGKLGLSGAKDLTQSALTHDEKMQVVANGKNAMMPFRDQLTEAQIHAVTSYLETLK